MRSIRLLGACLMAATLSACGGDDEGFDTTGDVIEAISEAACQRADECDQLGDTSVEDCIDQTVAAACMQTDCDASVPDDVSDDEIQSCVDDIGELSCDDEDLPPSCN